MLGSNSYGRSPPSFYFPWYGQCDFTLDGDCDGIPPEQDCNDFDADWSYQANDYDCDGKKRYEDCNELNPNVFEVTDGDEDCDENINDIEDCDRNMFATFTNNDADCDGIDVDLDCDDSDMSTDCINNYRFNLLIGFTILKLFQQVLIIVVV